MGKGRYKAYIKSDIICMCGVPIKFLKAGRDASKIILFIIFNTI